MMKKTLQFCMVLGLLGGTFSAVAATPEVSNVRVTQREGTNLVDIRYDVADTNNHPLTIALSLTADGIPVTAKALTGAVGAKVMPGMNKLITWDAGKDWPVNFSENVVAEVTADDGMILQPTGLYEVFDLSEGPNATLYPRESLEGVPSGGWTDEHKTTKLVMRKIPAGTYTMGYTGPGYGVFDKFFVEGYGCPVGSHAMPEWDYYDWQTETPHQVTLTQDFYMGIFEMTQKQYELITGKRPYFPSGDTQPVDTLDYGEIRGYSLGSQWPKNNQVDATSFLGRLRGKTGMLFDLPTEAQWEYACRAGTTTGLNNGMSAGKWTAYDQPGEGLVWEFCYPWYLDANAINIGNFYQLTGGSSTNVGCYASNTWGLYDMHGNITEWCLDWYKKDLGKAAVSDPKGPASGTERVYRNGLTSSWRPYGASVFDGEPEYTDAWQVVFIGFRACIQPAPNYSDEPGIHSAQSAASTVDTRPRVVVTFDANGGAPAKQNVTQVVDTEYKLLATPPSWSGGLYVFTGWFTAKIGGVQVTESTKVTQVKAHTLYAQWEPNRYTVTFNAQGGSVSPATKVVTQGQGYGTLPVPTRIDHAFLGWFTAPGGGTQVKANTKVTLSSPHTLHANWIYIFITVTFDANDGTPSSEDVEQTYGQPYVLPPPPEREGYTFLGWFTSPSGTGAPVTASTQVSANTRLYARWAVVSGGVSGGGATPVYVYAFADGPGTVSPASAQVVNGNPVTLTAKPDKDALFAGWSNGETTASIKVAPGTNAVYVARFSPKADAEEPELGDIEPPPNSMVGVPFEMQVGVSEASKPVKFSAAKLPSGLKINANTGLISGVPTKAGMFPVTIKVASAANSKNAVSTDVLIVVEPLTLNAQGTFNGYASEGTGVSGLFTATVSATGKFSAKVATTNGVWSFAAPSWSGKTGDVFYASIVTKKGETLTLALDSAEAWDTLSMTGTVNGFYGVTAQRNPCLNKSDATFGDAMGALGLYVSYYTLTLKGEAVPGSTGDAGNAPTGYGYLTATVNNKGAVKLAGKLADGTAASGSAALLMESDGALIPCFVLLYGKKGFYSSAVGVAVDGQAAGRGDWVYPGKTPAGKPPAVEDRFAVAVEVAGARYDTRAWLEDYFAGKAFFFGDDAESVIGIEATERGVLFVPKGKAPWYDRESECYAFDEDNPAVVTFSVNAKTGIFSGKFNRYEQAGAEDKPKVTTFSHTGVLVQKDGSSYGAGFYHVPETWQSGTVKYPIKRSFPVYLE